MYDSQHIAVKMYINYSFFTFSDKISFLCSGLCNSGGGPKPGVHSSQSPRWNGDSVSVWHHRSILRQVNWLRRRLRSRQQLPPRPLRGIHCFTCGYPGYSENLSGIFILWILSGPPKQPMDQPGSQGQQQHTTSWFVEAIHRARSFGGDATVLADYALTTTTNIISCHLSCGITQCYLPPDTSEQTPP